MDKQQDYKWKAYKYRIYPNKQQEKAIEAIINKESKEVIKAQSYTIKTEKTIEVENKHINIPTLGSVKIRYSQKHTGHIKTLTIRKTATNKYFISFHMKEKIIPLEKTRNKIGIDMGLENFVTLSTGEKYNMEEKQKNKIEEYEKKLEREKEKLKHKKIVAKRLNKNEEECKNLQKQLIKINKIKEKIRNIRKDFQDKLSKKIIKEYDTICIEDLDINKLCKNNPLKKDIKSAAWKSFIKKLEYKAKWYDKEIIKVDKYFPSSQICSVCGHRDGKKTLDIREWTCPFCHTLHDRDINASKNILEEGLKIKKTT